MLGRLHTTPRPSQQELADYLCIGAGFGHTNCVRLLLDAAACPNTPTVLGGMECGQRGETRRNALHEACLWGFGARDQVVTLLLQYRADVDLTAKLRGKQMTADRIAAQKGFPELGKLIHAHSQQLRACSRSRTPPNSRTNEATIAPDPGNAKNMAAAIMSECCACGTLPQRLGAKFRNFYIYIYIYSTIGDNTSDRTILQVQSFSHTLLLLSIHQKPPFRPGAPIIRIPFLCDTLIPLLEHNSNNNPKTERTPNSLGSALHEDHESRLWSH